MRQAVDDIDIKRISAGRTGAREFVMMLFFQMEVQNDYGSDIKTTFLKKYPVEEKHEKYIDHMCDLLREHVAAADGLIESCSSNWKIGRIGKVDLAVIRTAVLEIMHMDDIPDAVSINEAVTIAKKYGTEDSGKFVNGVLGKVVKVKNAG